MGDKQALHAFYATLVAICYLATLTLVLIYLGKNIEAAGFAGLTTGLIGLARSPGSKTVTVDNPPTAPVPVEPARV